MRYKSNCLKHLNPTKRKGIETMKINFDKWQNASIEQRAEWLNNGMELDDNGSRLLSWAFLFRDNGASISNETMLKVWYQM